KLGLAGEKLLLEKLPGIVSGNIIPKKQDENKATYAYNIKPEEEKLDFNHSSKAVYDYVRALRPRPLCHATVGGKQLKIIDVSVEDIGREYDKEESGTIIFSSNKKVLVKTQDGAVSLQQVQIEGKKEMDIKTFMNGLGRKILEKGRIFNR
ncbi:MAG TPA: hypothetical protein P5042_05325, partial [Candidatus Izemoplasmatales bacterium]|nr:hypothetical protein [Candidatus Izemoplasmatales bacterium]